MDIRHRLPVKTGDTDPVCKDTAENMVVEEHRKDASGRLHVHKYLRGRLLGKGGFAKCYHGTSIATSDQYALKVVDKATLAKPRAKQKLQSEIMIHRNLNHENIVRFERFFEDSSNAYMLLELCKNNSMSELIRRRKRVTEPESRYYIIQIVNALSYLHSCRVIHRDLKLGNIFLDADMIVKVGDFGLATKLSHMDERKRTVCGTPNYIAPEILQGQDGHSFEVDIWSTGVILYTLLVGKPPFGAKDVKGTYRRILAMSYEFPASVPISDQAKQLIQDILQLKPERRPKLNVILDHPFFQKPNTYTPTSLTSAAMRTVPPLCSSIADIKFGCDNVPVTNENDPHAINRVPVTVLNDQKGVADKPPLRAMTTTDVLKPAGYSKRYTRSSTAATVNRSSGRLDNVPPQTTRSQTPHLMRGINQPLQNNYLDDKKIAATRSASSSTRLTRSSSTSTHEIAENKCDNMEIEAEAGVEQMQHGFEHFCIEGTNEHACVSDDAPMEVELRRASSVAWNDPKEIVPLSTPVNNTTPHVRINRDLGTIETMHQTLKEFTADRHQITGEVNANVLAPAVWVVRHVDYTAKYGLGFLLNTGAVGVYFNDSTKIVLSASGRYFQYIERRKCPGSAEHHSQCYALANFPSELGKKVTLLKHFRNYLYEQQANSGSTSIAGLMKPFAESNRNMMTQAELNCVDELPYIKKWVRTRHAILFRLSNRTVQVMFFDESEILLASEAKVVTYVDKDRVRSNHTLDSIVENGRTDIAKRLKYTKDIMYRLIHLQQPK